MFHDSQGVYVTITRMSTSPSARSVIGAGLALIILPVVAITIKTFVYAGWGMLFILIIGIGLLAGYALQVVIAATAMLRAHGVFRRMPGAKRGVAAAWITSVGAVLTASFMIDGGDDGRFGSLFTVLTGTSSTPQGQEMSAAGFGFFCAAWIGGWIWLVCEWIVLLVRARRERKNAEGSATS